MSQNNMLVLPGSFIGSGRDIDYVYTKYPVDWQGKTNCIEMDWNPNLADLPAMNSINELNFWFALNPGDHVVWRAWLYAENQTSGDNTPWRGALIALDLFNAEGNMKTELGSPTGQQSYTPSTNTWVDRTGCYAARGSNNWILASMDFIVKETYENSVSASLDSPYQMGTPFVPGFAALLIINQAGPDYTQLEKGRIWIWNPELYINPGVTPTPPPIVYTCPTCQATFSSQAELDAHIASAHPPPPPPTYQEWIVTRTEPQPTQEWKITVTSPPKVSGWV